MQAKGGKQILTTDRAKIDVKLHQMHCIDLVCAQDKVHRPVSRSLHSEEKLLDKVPGEDKEQQRNRNSANTFT